MPPPFVVLLCGDVFRGSGQNDAEGRAEAEKQTLAILHTFSARHGYMPTISEIAGQMRLPLESIKTVLTNLAKKGRIRPGPHKARAIALSDV